MEKKSRNGRAKRNGIAVIFAAMFFVCSPLLAEEVEKVTLDAARVMYDDEAGAAEATGSAVMRYRDTVIRAERIDYDVTNQKVTARPALGETVSLQSDGRIIRGNSLEYNLGSEEGVMEGVKSGLPIESGILYLSGGDLQILPYGAAAERGLVKKKSEPDASYVGLGENISATTCALDHPHYRVESKRIIFVPGKQVTAKSPRLYLGKTYIMTYPMDYVVDIDREALKYSVTPYFQNSNAKGGGGGLSGAFTWETGSVAIGGALWSRAGAEWMAEIEQQLGGGFKIKGGIDYSWDEAWDDKIYHPYAALSYEVKKWTATVRWSHKEYIEDQKDSLYKYQGHLTREPEVSVSSPWLRDPAINSSWFRLNAVWGMYREKTVSYSSETISRWGAEVQSYLELPVGKLANVFWNVRYGAWFYDRDSLSSDGSQEALGGILGVRYSFGALEMATGYERRYVWGSSPMFWDAWEKAEKIHQKIRFPVGREVFLSMRGSYDLEESLFDEVTYSLQWINDCMKWELFYYNDRTSGSNNRMSLSVAILALPNTPASFGEYKREDPFLRPSDLP
ncbi:organic solvent tolerance protein OstA [Synergistales bacterium]|nr:organic solvent tolerance protein OstA [Synergistales bacterium]